VSDWRKTEYRPVEQPKPSGWEDLKFGMGVPLLVLATIGCAVGAIYFLLTAF
jgi:hypothetical protein